MLQCPTPTQMNKDLVVPPVSENIKIISPAMFSSQNNAAILRGPMAANFIKQLLVQADWGELDYLLIDYPPGTGDIQITLSQVVSIDAALLITTPQKVALSDVRKAFFMFDAVKIPVLGILENMSYFVCDSCDKKHRIFKRQKDTDLERELGIPKLTEIPIISEISEASDTGNNFFSENGLTQDIQKNLQQACSFLVEQTAAIKINSQQTLSSFHLKWRA